MTGTRYPTLPGFFLKILGFRVVSLHAVFSHLITTMMPFTCTILRNRFKKGRQLCLFKRSIRTECKSNDSSIATSKIINNCIFAKKKKKNYPKKNNKEKNKQEDKILLIKLKDPNLIGAQRALGGMWPQGADLLV